MEDAKSAGSLPVIVDSDLDSVVGGQKPREKYMQPCIAGCGTMTSDVTGYCVRCQKIAAEKGRPLVL